MVKLHFLFGIRLTILDQSMTKGLVRLVSQNDSLIATVWMLARGKFRMTVNFSRICKS